MLDLGRPLLLEGDAGVGKTEVAKALAAVRGARLIRLQCYEGLDVHAAMYEWNYQRQLLAIKLLEHDERPTSRQGAGHLLRALSAEAPAARSHQLCRTAGAADRRSRSRRRGVRSLPARIAVGLPDVDSRTRHRARRYQPLVVITSNGTRELSDALRRRCLYQYIDYPTFAKELAIVEIRAPQAAGQFAHQVVDFVQSVRRMDLQKKPGIAETLDWTAALLRMGISVINEDGAERILDTLSALIKTRDDRAGFTREVVARVAASC